MTTRPLVLSDIPQLSDWLGATELWQHYQFQPEATQAMLERALKKSDLMLVTEHKKVGSGLIWCQPGAAFGRSGYVRLLAVQPKYQRQGLGSKLLLEAEDFIGRVSNDMFLLVSDFNTAAQGFYERRGYQQIGQIEDYVKEGVTELIYRKRLEDA